MSCAPCAFNKMVFIDPKKIKNKKPGLFFTQTEATLGHIECFNIQII
jgi:hypothetical protein